MNIAVRYQSRNNNTRSAAEIIAKSAGVEAMPVSEPLREHTDILFVGGGVYNWNADKTLLDFLENLDPKKVGQIAAFSTSGMMSITIKRIFEYAKKVGIAVNSNSLCLKMYGHGHASFGLQGGKLSDKQKEDTRQFTKSVLGSVKD